LKVIANSNAGIMDFLYDQSNLNILILSLDSSILSSRTSAAEFLLAIVTLEYPRGHSLVIKAFENFQAERNEDRLFQKLLKSLYEVIRSRGIFGSVVGSKRERMSFIHASKNTNDLDHQREIKDYLVRESLSKFSFQRRP
jgi:hypothetical protein